MLNLEKLSGLPIFLEDNGCLVLGDGVSSLPPSSRTLPEFQSLLAPGSDLSGPQELYFMYRGIAKKEDQETWQRLNLRYDITVIFPGIVGREFIKTMGHYHSLKKGTDVGYPEIYEVIKGKAHYLLQKVEGNKVVDVKIIEAKEGDKVVVPPGYGHISINPGKEILVMSNIQSINVLASYDEIYQKQGGVFYELSDENWIKNENYENKFEPMIVEANQFADVFEVQNKMPMYVDFMRNPEKYDFLDNPEKYLEEFGRIYS